MSFTTDTFASPVDGTPLRTYSWGADLESSAGVVQIAHGIAEHAERYDRLAEALLAAGYRVCAVDHRGHGKSIVEGGIPGSFGEAGYAALITDVAALGESLQSEGLPLFLVAHSMGSFAAQAVLLDHSDLYRGVVLSGSTALDVLAANLSGADQPVGLEAFNAGFEHRTGFEWLTRDPAEVDKYVADPLSGFDLPDDALPQLFADADGLADPEALRGIRPGLPILIASGQDDPVAGGGQLVELVGQRYREAGLTDVTVKVYPDARHEIFNETNRDEVTADVVAWLQAHS